MMMTPGMVGLVLAQDASQTPIAASDDEIQVIQQLVQSGLSGRSKETITYPAQTALTEDDVTDAIFKSGRLCDGSGLEARSRRDTALIKFQTFNLYWNW